MGMSTVNGSQLKDQIAGDDFSPKVRKPYTISKQRERWTEEEHKKFLEALKLYGRAWRKIEEHVGTKTAVQIRSHAQKYFSKVVRESNTSDSTSEKPIEIPPPRPKRKPMHPYPRKLVSPFKDGILVPGKLARSASLNLSISEQENQSPTSVLSAVGSDASAGEESRVHNGSPSPVSSAPSVDAGHESENSSQDEQLFLGLELLCQKNPLIQEDSKESGMSSLKLFGKTILVEGPQGACKPESLDTSEDNCLFPRRVVPIRIPRPFHCAESSEKFPDTLPWLTLCGGASLSTLEVHNPTAVRAQPLGVKNEMPDKDEQKEASSTSSNLDDRKEKVEISFSSYKLSKRISACSKDRRRGFVPYKRCLVETDSNISSTETAEARENQRIRICS